MKFNEYKYERIDVDKINDTVTSLLTQFNNANNSEEAITMLEKIFEIISDVSSMVTLANIRFSVNTQDDFYKSEDAFLNENLPLISSIEDKINQAILDSKYLEELKKVYPKTFFMLTENRRKAFNEKIIPLLQVENTLVSEYNSLIASAQIEFNGNTYTLPEMGKFTVDKNREIRKTAYEATTNFFVQHEQKFDEIYDKLVKTRHEIATTLGYKNYTELGYIIMNRFDYTEEKVATYRQEVVKYVVPIVQKLREKQAKRLGLDHLKYYDLSFEYLSGNATPKLNSEEILQAGKNMYHELSNETAEFIDFMFDHDLFDVLSKQGKQGGGYCTYIPKYRSPFIFANFNGTSADIDVLTHEAGHAFQVFRSRDIKPEATIWPTYETCEIHSMSMEFITWPWMENFFKEDTDKYKYSHLASGLTFLPYGVCVDHFQHEVYNNPHMSIEERKQVWRNLENLYLPDRDYSDNDYLSRGNFWVRQAHIFASPFYYIDYTLAQICAYQFWRRTHVDKDPTAWKDYLNICDCGGTKTFLEVVKLANINSPFEQGALKSTLDAIDNYLDNVDDSKF